MPYKTQMKVGEEIKIGESKIKVLECYGGFCRVEIDSMFEVEKINVKGEKTRPKKDVFALLQASLMKENGSK